MTKTCSTCAHYRPYHSTADAGGCLLLPPVALPCTPREFGDPAFFWGNPEVGAEHRCGQHKEASNA